MKKTLTLAAGVCALFGACAPKASTAIPIPQITLDTPGNSIDLQVREVTLPSGTHCIVANNNCRGIALQCDFRGNQTHSSEAGPA